jgi:kynurenine formamidase
MPRLVCLSRPIDPNLRESVPSEMRPLANVIAPVIDFLRPEAKGRDRMMSIFCCAQHDLPHGEGWGEEFMTDMNSHCGTHVDAPYHSGNRSEGKPARKIHEIELQELFCSAMVLDMRRYLRRNDAYSIDELRQAIDAVGRPIQPGDAVLLRTGQEAFTPADLDWWSYPGMSREGTLFLAEAGAKVLGTDALGWDRPFPVMSKIFKQTGDSKAVWDGHFAIQEKEAFIVQQMHNLSALPATGFMVGFFPIKLVGTSAAPARVVAFFGD